MTFHKNEKLGTPEITIKMKRLFVETVSITSVRKMADEIEMSYIDFSEKRGS
jgi:hypothetical protein